MTAYYVSNLQNRDREKFLMFCEEASRETEQPASPNMWHEDWKNHKNTLPYNVFINGRFAPPQGEIFLLWDDFSIIGCGGIYRSEFCEDLAIAGCRTWANKPYRNLNLTRELLLPAQKKWAIDKGFGAIALTFNEYNKNIIKMWERKGLGDNKAPRGPHHIFYNGLEKLDFTVEIQHTTQYLIYEKLDPDWYFDWEGIRSK